MGSPEKQRRTSSGGSPPRESRHSATAREAKPDSRPIESEDERSDIPRKRYRMADERDDTPPRRRGKADVENGGDMSSGRRQNQGERKRVSEERRGRSPSERRK